MRANHFINLETESEMDHTFAALVEEIMGELHTTINAKYFEILQALIDKNQAWNIKRPSAPTESPREINQLHSTIDVSKVEDLMKPWTIEEILRREA